LALRVRSQLRDTHDTLRKRAQVLQRVSSVEKG
jgi:hypothetical protein